MTLAPVPPETTNPPTQPPPALQTLFPDSRVLHYVADGWSITNGGTAWLTPGTYKFHLTVLLADNRNRLQLRVLAGGQNSVVYEFTGRRVTRVSTLGGKRQSVTLLKRSKDAADIAVSLHIEPHSISLAGTDGGASDVFQSDAVDFTAGQIGISGNAHFTIRTN